MFVIAWSAAVVLLFAGSSKLAEPARIGETLAALSISWPWAGTTLALLELAAGAGLVLAPDSLVTALLVIGLGIAFSCAGAFAVLHRIRVECACVGPLLDGILGVRQIALLPVWMAVAVVGLISPAGSSADERTQVLSVLVVVLCVGATLRLFPIAQEHRTLRLLLSKGR